MTTIEDVKRAQVLYMPAKLEGPPSYLHRLLYAAGLIGAVVGVWLVVVAVFAIR